VAWLKEFAEQRGLEWAEDSVGNLVIRRPGSGGGEAAAPVIIQGHVDMVTEANADSTHDFLKDPIRLLRDGDWVTADGTTLGADNGIGVCAALAVLDLPPTARLPPIEALFTIDEETGLTGAFGLEGSMLRGRTMLNLDTEEWPEVFIGCAGGGDSVLTLPCALEAAPAGAAALEVRVSGLLGGHSGVDIHEDRGNAVRMAAAAADAVLSRVAGARLASLAGGDKRNAIARECAAVLAVPAAERDAAAAVVASVEADFRAEFGHREPGLRIAAAPLEGAAPAAALAPADAERLLALLLTLPHGVIKYSHEVPGLVETSSNLASVRPAAAAQGGRVTYRLQCSTRSSLMPALERCRAAIRRTAALCGAAIQQDEAYPGWAPQPGAAVVGVARAAIAEVVGREPALKAIHAGLECGIIGEKLPGVQSVSYGPTIRGAHSPDERVQVSTVAPFWEATLNILGRLAGER
jgi:dipeptidase D